MRTEKRRAQCREAQRRYRQTAKGRATKQRYRDSLRGQAMEAISTKRRIWLGRRRLGRMPTVEQAEAIRAHIQRRQREFRAAQNAEASADA